MTVTTEFASSLEQKVRLIEQIQEMINHIQDSYIRSMSKNDTLDVTGLIDYQLDMIDHFCNNIQIQPGTKFIKITVPSGSSESVHSFVVAEDAGKFKCGDILKAASYRAPAKNFARGNVFTGDFSRITWTGAN